MTSDSEGGRGFGKSDAYWRGEGGGFGVNWRQIFFTNLTKNWINFSLSIKLGLMILLYYINANG